MTVFSEELVEQIRRHFPALQREVNGRTPAFFDAPGGTQVPRVVIDAIAEYLALHNANTGGAFPASIETDAMIWRARERMAAFLNAPSPREIVFGANMTTLTFALSRALGAEWGAGDEVVVTTLDHQANIAPWVRVAEERGMTVRTVPFDPESVTLDFDVLRGSIGPRTRLVAVGYASNAVGTITDVRQIARLAREVGALCFVDAVHFAPHRLLDVQEMGCDWVACSVYKFFGPHVGVLWGRQEHLERFRPFKVPPALDTAPERWETGTLNHEGIAGTAAAVEWIASLAPHAAAEGERPAIESAMRLIERQEMALFSRLLDGLQEIPGVRIYGPPAGTARTPTVGFNLRGYTPREVAARLSEEGISVWEGDFYASTVVQGLGLAERGGLLRAGLAPYVTTEDVDRLLEALRALTR
ncbi:MAG: cysteine desulfurase-like protein [Longimicrobiaceae bacterium]